MSGTDKKIISRIGAPANRGIAGMFRAKKVERILLDFQSSSAVEYYCCTSTLRSYRLTAAAAETKYLLREFGDRLLEDTGAFVFSGGGGAAATRVPTLFDKRNREKGRTLSPACLQARQSGASKAKTNRPWRYVPEF